MTIRLAFDKGSVRRYDQDGRLHVSLAHISKANVCPYLGSEIPGAEALGLEPKRIYQLLRDPQELEKAAASSNNIQLLIQHNPVSADDPKKELVVGSTGTDGTFNAPYLDNSLVVWDAPAIEGIESDEQKELSAGYHYRADMTPGTYEGVAYDGVMRDIRFNHVALVVEGRAGDDVVVGDSALHLSKENLMSKKQYLSRLAAMAKGALTVSLAPSLAQDAKLDLTPLLVGVAPSNWKASKAKIIAGLKTQAAKFKDKPAMDAAMEDVVKLLDSLDGEQLGDKPDDDLGVDNPDKNLDGVTDPNGTNIGKDSPAEALMAFLKGKISPEDMAKVEEMMKPAADDADGDGDVDAFVKNLMDAMKAMKKPAAADVDPAAKPTPSAQGPNMKDMVSKPAMDAAIKEAVGKAVADAEAKTVKRMNAIAEAERLVEPYIGKINIAQDSAEAIYRLALDDAGINLDGVPPSAYKAMVGMLPKPGDDANVQVKKPGMAIDSSTVVDFAKRFPNAGRVRQLG